MKKFTRSEKMGALHAVAIETESEKERFNRLLDEVGEWVAVILWCGGAYRIDPRDRFIGWDSKKREERHGLVTQCSRFAGRLRQSMRSLDSLGCPEEGRRSHFLECVGKRYSARRRFLHTRALRGAESGAARKTRRFIGCSSEY